jgi:hypothetical protein
MTRRLATLATLAYLAGCGGSATSAGSGTGTLFVDAQISEQDGNASFRVQVRQNNAGVLDAVVKLDGGGGSATLTTNGDGFYRGSAPGWDDHYTLSVSSGADHLNGSIEAPRPAPIVAPDPTVAFDPHKAAGGLVELRWSGTLADTAEVHSHEFDWGPMADPGRLTIAASIFADTSQEVRVTRETSTPLAGGVTGSTLTADISTTTDLLVVNPF